MLFKVNIIIKLLLVIELELTFVMVIIILEKLKDNYSMEKAIFLPKLWVGMMDNGKMV
jgi:hypothetical protein